jgi:hypothetical protein
MQGGIGSAYLKHRDIWQDAGDDIHDLWIIVEQVPPVLAEDEEDSTIQNQSKTATCHVPNTTHLFTQAQQILRIKLARLLH